MNNTGRHLILDLYQCDPGVLDDYEKLVDVLTQALVLSRATVLQVVGHRFQPQGVTLLVLLAESHASIHTWPDERYAAIDFYTCNSRTDTEGIKALLKKS
jgi:S-adenosylmethionine decarboxylase proenzyme